MKLNQIWTNFTGRMSEIMLFYAAAEELAQKEHSLLSDYQDLSRSHDENKELPMAFQFMVFKDARTGDDKLYNQINRSLEALRIHVILHKNKQSQWLLAEAYEEFEDFIGNAYAHYGSVNNSFWPMSDYGNISLSELSEKKYEWYVEQARKKKDVPRTILNRFRKQFPELKKIEEQNALKINLALAITLIEKLRHIIVHKGGKVDSKDNFIQLVTEQSGLSNGGKKAQEHKDFINTFFGKNEYENLITLETCVTITENQTSYSYRANLFGELINFLMAYAFLIYEQIDSNLNS